jgi:hypothetical protein
MLATIFFDFAQQHDEISTRELSCSQCGNSAFFKSLFPSSRGMWHASGFQELSKNSKAGVLLNDAKEASALSGVDRKILKLILRFAASYT